MNPIIGRMLERYAPATASDHVRALREILQAIALLGLWRAKFFDKAAFYGGTSLRLLHGLDRFSEDLDFSLLGPALEFSLSSCRDAMVREMESFGFEVTFEARERKPPSPIDSAFIKAVTRRQLLVIDAGEAVAGRFPGNQLLKIRLEVDVDPPAGFRTELRYLLLPVPFPIRAYTLPDLFAGKMHAILCRGWKSRVKGRDWYDLVWYAANHPVLDLAHLEERMHRSGHLPAGVRLDRARFDGLLRARIDSLRVDQIRDEVAPYLRDAGSLDLWSKEFFLQVIQRIDLGPAGQPFTSPAPAAPPPG